MSIEKTREEYLYLLRKFQKMESLDKIIAHKELTLSEKELVKFYGAADHRRAELVTGRLYDKVPKEVWKLLY